MNILSRLRNVCRQNIFFIKYLKHIAIIVVLPLTLFYFILALSFVNTYKSEQKLRINSNLEQCESTISNIFFQIDTYYRNCAFDSNILNLTDNPLQYNNTIGNYTPIINATTAAQNMHNFINPITQIYLYSKKSDYVYGLYGFSSNYMPSFDDTAWYDTFKKHDFQNCIFRDKYNGEEYLVFCYNIQKSGILTVKVSLPMLYEEMHISEDADSLILAETDSGTKMINLNPKENISKLPSVEIADIGATLYYMPADIEDKNVLSINVFSFVLLVIFTMVFTVLLSFVFSKSEYSAIRSVISEIQSPYIDRYTSSEKKLIETIDKNANFNQKLKNELMNKISELKTNQLIALQSQINPHFISNTLNMISSSIMMNNEEDTDAIYMLKHLSGILQYSLRLHEYIVTFENELDSLESYITILGLRIGNTFNTVYDIPDDVKSAKTLKFLVQPIVENAIIHGIQPLNASRRCTLTIKAYKKDGRFYITVSNDGKEFDSAKLAEITKSLNGDITFSNKSIGLKNVVSRIKLLFGQKGGFIIKSTLEATSVTIYHPIID